MVDDFQSGHFECVHFTFGRACNNSEYKCMRMCVENPQCRYLLVDVAVHNDDIADHDAIPNIKRVNRRFALGSGERRLDDVLERLLVLFREVASDEVVGIAIVGVSIDSVPHTVRVLCKRNK